MILNKISESINKKQRDLDIKILWPLCVKRSRNMNEAIRMFLIHTTLDKAWKDIDALPILEELVIKERIKDE